MPKPLVLPWKTYDTFKAALADVDMVNRREKQPMRVWVCRTGDAGWLLCPVDPTKGRMRDRFHRLVVRPVNADGTPDHNLTLTGDDFAPGRRRWGAIIVLYYQPPGGMLRIEQIDQVNIEPYQCWEEVWQ